jgi:hypothetical protein
VPRIDHCVVAVDVEDPVGDVAEQLFECPWFQCFADCAGEAVITGDGRLGLGQA